MVQSNTGLTHLFLRRHDLGGRLVELLVVKAVHQIHNRRDEARNRGGIGDVAELDKLVGQSQHHGHELQVEHLSQPAEQERIDKPSCWRGLTRRGTSFPLRGSSQSSRTAR